MKQLIDHMKLKKKEGLSVDVSMSLRRGNKIIMGGRRRFLGGRGEKEEKKHSRVCSSGCV